MASVSHLPSRIPRNTKVLTMMLFVVAIAEASTIGFDQAMMTGLNILPGYSDYFHLNTVTLALNTSIMWVGSIVCAPFVAPLADGLGRKNACYVCAVISLVAIILQSAAQNIAMFLVARALIGFGISLSGAIAPIYLSETIHFQWRGPVLGCIYTFWYIGGLIAAGVCYGTSYWENSTWSWRVPSILQCIFCVGAIALLPFLPESPRWLIDHGRFNEAKEVVALMHSNGDETDPVAIAQYREIVDTLAFEKSEQGQQSTVKVALSTSSNRRRLLLVASVGVFVMLSGNNIISYYLGTMLSNAGITNTRTQLKINIILNAWCLCIACIGTYCSERLGRKRLILISTSLLTIFLFLIGGLTKAYGTSSNTSGIYGTVAAIFLFQGSYSFGWTPITVTYPPEVLSYPIRAIGMGLFTFCAKGIGLMATFAFPIALEHIGWKTYMINGGWDVIEVLFIYFLWDETKGKSLEEINELFGEEKRSNVADLAEVSKGGETLVGMDLPAKTAEFDVNERRSDSE